jgi:hypothetical protein
VSGQRRKKPDVRAREHTAPTQYHDIDAIQKMAALAEAFAHDTLYAVAIDGATRVLS